MLNEYQELMRRKAKRDAEIAQLKYDFERDKAVVESEYGDLDKQIETERMAVMKAMKLQGKTVVFEDVGKAEIRPSAPKYVIVDEIMAIGDIFHNGLYDLLSIKKSYLNQYIKANGRFSVDGVQVMVEDELAITLIKD